MKTECLLVSDEMFSALKETLFGEEKPAISNLYELRVFTADWMPEDRYCICPAETAQMILSVGRVLGGERALKLLEHWASEGEIEKP